MPLGSCGSVGALVRAWVAIPAAYLGFVLIAWIGETAAFLHLGASEWEVRNSEHWQGDAPAWVKLLGQLLEYPVFTLMAMPFVALGVVSGRSARRAFRGDGHWVPRSVVARLSRRRAWHDPCARFGPYTDSGRRPVRSRR